MRVTLRPMTLQERKYSYATHPEISTKSGFIGYLRGDFGSSGNQFYSTYFTFQPHLKTNEFRAEFDIVINAFRENPDYAGILKDRQNMATYCHAHPESGFDGNYTREYGFRVNTDDFTYMLRLNPSKGDYNFYLLCA